MARSLSLSARSAMIATAIDVLNQRGVDGFTIDEVARLSGVAKSTIYRHFPSGDELILAAASAMVEQDVVPDTGSLRGDVTAIMAKFLVKRDDPSLRRFFLSMLVRAIDDPQFGQLQQAMMRQRNSPLRVAVQRGIARGEVDPSIDLDIAVRLLHAPVVMRRLIENESISAAEVEQTLDLTLFALAPRRNDETCRDQTR